MAGSDENSVTPNKTKHEDEMFCSSCGEIVKKQAVICVHCGVPIRSQSISRPGSKNKVASVVLAVLFGFFAWLYTYEKDKSKFWINLGLTIITLGIWGVTVGWLWPIIDLAIKPNEFFENYPNG